MRMPITIFLLLLCMSYVQAQDNKLIFKGDFMTDQRLRTVGTPQWGWNENRLDLSLESKLKGQARFYGNLWFRSFGFPGIEITDHLYNKNNTSPYNIDFREGFVDFYDFIIPKLDLRIGRQELGWGKADRINPTNNLNPLDLEDIWDFGRYQGSDAIKLSYYIKDYKLEGIWLPFFRPSTLPAGDWAQIFQPEIELPAGMALKSYTDSIFLPSLNLKESSSYGLKLGGRLLGLDWSGSYTYAYDPLPMGKRNVITLASLTEINILAKLGFFRQHIAGFDFSGQIGSIGIWGEAALFKPAETQIMTTDLSAFGIADMDSIMLDDHAYVKFIIGGDYTFKDASYLNFQYLHGFFHERGNTELNDYFFLSYRKIIMNDKLQLEPLSGAFIVGDWKDVKNNFSIIYNPSITYYPNDNTEISLGYRLIEGKGGNLFALVKDKDEVFMKVIYHF